MSGTAILFWILAIPVVGFALAIWFSNALWLWLLLPLFAFHEGGLVLVIVMVIIAISIIG